MPPLIVILSLVFLFAAVWYVLYRLTKSGDVYQPIFGRLAPAVNDVSPPPAKAADDYFVKLHAAFMIVKKIKRAFVETKKRAEIKNS